MDKATFILLIASIILAVTLTASILINIFQWVLYKKDLKEKDEHNEDQLLLDKIRYIDEQIDKTKARLTRESKSKNNTNVLNARLAYLNIEKKILRGNLEGTEYWKFVIDSVSRLLQAFLPKDAKNPSSLNVEGRINAIRDKVKFLHGDEASENYARTEKILNSFLVKYRNAKKDHETIDEYLKKMESTVHGFERENVRKFLDESKSAEDYAQKSQKIIAQLNQHLEEQEKTIHGLEKEITKYQLDQNRSEADQKRLDMLQVKLEKTKKENEELTKTVNELNEKILSFNVRAKEQENIVRQGILNEDISDGQLEIHSQGLRDMSQELVAETNREVHRLRDMLKRQSSSILTLDETIDGLKSKLNEAQSLVGEKERRIEDLERNIRDSESCIRTLETYVDDLRVSVPRQDDGDSKSLDSLSRELDRVKSELDRVTAEKEINEEVIHYMFDAMEANSLEDLVALYYQELISLQTQPSIDMQFGKKHLSISDSGKMSKTDKLLVENMELHEANIGADDRSIKFKTKHLMGVIRANDDVQAFKKNHRRIIGMSKVTDKLIEKVGYAQLYYSQKKNLSLHSNDLKKIAYEVDKILEKQNDKAKGVVLSSLAKLEKELAEPKADAAVKVDFKDIRKKAAFEIDDDRLSRIATRKLFLNYLSKLNLDE